jgi:hypothetical protein
MNPHRVYREIAYEALASQAEAKKYGVFVAMPYRDEFSYRSDDIFTGVISESVELANSKSPRRPFEKPIRPDKIASGASEITDHIVEGILRNHFFIADLTLANHGVLVETGVALALKSAKHIILIAQGNLNDLHFDLKGNHVICYDKAKANEAIAEALVEAAKDFESALGDRMSSIIRDLTPLAVYLMRVYGQRRLDRGDRAGLHFGVLKNDEYLGRDESIRELTFNDAAHELLDKKLLYLKYRAADGISKSDTYGLHATSLGLVFIKKTWPDRFKSLK